ncbi:MAG: thioredoxin family protein, partial [Myxococcota bacterium]
GCAGAKPPPTPILRGLPFISDDYPRALAEAKQRKLPLFIDAWADWCHTCRFMKSHVLVREELTPHAGRFVWLEVDTEKEKNAAFLEKHPIEVWPTFLVIDPATETEVFRWVGSATVEQLTKLFDDAHRAWQNPYGAGANGALLRADRSFAQKHYAEAARTYREALLLSTGEWPKRGRAVESLLFAHYSAKELEPCAQAAADLAPTLSRGPSFANAVVMGLSCALAGEGNWRDEALAVLEPLAVEAVSAPGLLADDRSGVFDVLVELRKKAKDEAGARKWASQWLTFLEAEAAKTPTVEARAAFDSHRLVAALELKAPERVLEALTQSERELPHDSNPPARLAIAYRELGRLDEALAAVERALGKVAGPRRIRVLETKASVLERKGDTAGARKTLEEALFFAQSLPAPQRSATSQVRLQAALKKLP